jgi:hypothetical protein
MTRESQAFPFVLTAEIYLSAQTQGYSITHFTQGKRVATGPLTLAVSAII